MGKGMIALLDTSENLTVCSHQLDGIQVEQLFTPLTMFKSQNQLGKFAIDNGAYSKFRYNSFLSLLERELPRKELCRFVSVPDVVGNAFRTAEVFKEWMGNRLLQNYPLAYVCQDGQESVSIPWNNINAIFIGGTNEFKLGRGAVDCIKSAQLLNKWVHVGRVNTPNRWSYFEDLGVNSVDGTGLSRFKDMREKIRSKQIDLIPSPYHQNQEEV